MQYVSVVYSSFSQPVILPPLPSPPSPPLPFPLSPSPSSSFPLQAALKRYWTDPNLSRDEAFLRDYLLNRGYLDMDAYR